VDESSLLRQVAGWGYYLLPRSHPHSPGHPGLLIAIRQKPTEKHFDPQSILQRYEKAPALRHSFPRFYAALAEEKQWPAHPVGLDELLAPP
jgi:hypothetical protein